MPKPPPQPPIGRASLPPPDVDRWLGGPPDRSDLLVMAAIIVGWGIGWGIVGVWFAWLAPLAAWRCM